MKGEPSFSPGSLIILFVVILLLATQGHGGVAFFMLLLAVSLAASHEFVKRLRI